jgi:hypothetical protein
MYAYKRTGGLILTEEMREHWPPDRVQEWDAAEIAQRAASTKTTSKKCMRF